MTVQGSSVVSPFLMQNCCRGFGFNSPLERERAGSTTLLPVRDSSVLWNGKGLGLRHCFQCVIHQSFGTGKG